MGRLPRGAAAIAGAIGLCGGRLMMSDILIWLMMPMPCTLSACCSTPHRLSVDAIAPTSISSFDDFFDDEISAAYVSPNTGRAAALCA